jgi:hypothetical protein
MQKIAFFLFVLFFTFVGSPLSAQTDAFLIYLKDDGQANPDRYFVMAFADEYSEGFDANEDALTLDTEGLFAVYCLDGNDTGLLMWGVPMKDNRVVRVVFSVPAAGTYTLRIDYITGPSAALKAVNLIDNIENKMINLNETSTYTFTTTGQISKDMTRFSLQINPVASPMVVAGKVLVKGTMRSKGAVHVFASTDTGKIDIGASATLLTDTVILYSNDNNDGLLRNQNEQGGVKGITFAFQPAKVIVRKSLASQAWRYIVLPFDVNIGAGGVRDNGIPLEAAKSGVKSYWLKKFDAEARSRLSTTDVKYVWPDFEDSEYAGSLKKGTGYLFLGSANLANIDFVTTDATDINNLFKVDDKTVNYTTYISAAGAWDHPGYGDGWAFIGGLNTTTFKLNRTNIGNYNVIAATVYPVKTTQASGQPGEILVGLGGDREANISPYTPFYIHIGTNTLIAAYSEDSTFIFKKEGLSLEGSSAGFRSANEDIKDQLYFALSSDRDNSYDRFYLTFADHYSESFNANEDAITMMTISETSPAIWCLDGANVELALNGLPMKDDRKVGMGFAVPEAGDYTFRMDAQKLTDVRNVILVDNVTGKKVDLLQVPYSFTSEAVKNENDRFVLYINSSYTDIPLVEAGKPYAYAKDNILTVKNLLEGDAVSIYDLSGRTLVSGTVSGAEFSTVLTQKGVYIVNVKGEKTTILKVLNK